MSGTTIITAEPVSMTPDEFAAKMNMLSAQIRFSTDYISDREIIHQRMDALLCSVLQGLGYGVGVDIFLHTPKVW